LNLLSTSTYSSRFFLTTFYFLESRKFSHYFCFLKSRIFGVYVYFLQSIKVIYFWQHWYITRYQLSHKSQVTNMMS